MEEVTKISNFIHDFIDEDLENGVYNKVQTRFPPEPNGYLHIGHAKAICINFATSKKYKGECNLRLDDTNPQKEDTEYIDAIKEDIEWLGFKWNKCLFASSYFDYIYECAVKLIEKGLAYVDDLSADEIREYRGTLTEPGKNSPYRDRSVEENLDLFKRMTDGEFPNGAKVLRAKIDMASPNLNMRDPIMYRISHTSHHQTGDKWCVYPMYDFAHPIQDALEGITHSLCSSEFRNHRPLYDWVVEKIGFEQKPHQFGRMNITYTVMSKRYLRQLVEEGYVDGWDDPRLPTLCGLRRRGYTPSALFTFVREAGVTNTDHTVDVRQLEACVRDDLNANAPRAMAVLRPLKVVIDNWATEGDDGKPMTKMVELPNNPLDESAGMRQLPFSGVIWIDRADFMEIPEKKFFRMAPGQEVRLRGACIFKCTGCEKDADGKVTEIHGTWDPESWGGNAVDGRKVKGTIHWVDCATGQKAQVRLYDRLFTEKDPLKDGSDNFLKYLNPDSLKVVEAYVEPALASATAGEHFQFERTGYFVCDAAGGFNRTCSLKDSYKPA